jgi:hypothetical protein
MKTIVLLVLLAVCAGAQAEQVYAWTDAAGVRHFSDSPPPPGVTNAKRLTIHGGMGATTSEPAKAAPDDTKGQDAGATAPMEDSPETRAKACRTARANLELLRSNYRVSLPTGADGKTQVLDDDQRKLEVAKAEDQVSFYCK